MEARIHFDLIICVIGRCGWICGSSNREGCVENATMHIDERDWCRLLEFTLIKQSAINE
jgi:hypothetical protein